MKLKRIETDRYGATLWVWSLRLASFHHALRLLHEVHENPPAHAEVADFKIHPRRPGDGQGAGVAVMFRSRALESDLVEELEAARERYRSAGVSFAGIDRSQPSAEATAASR